MRKVPIIRELLTIFFITALFFCVPVDSASAESGTAVSIKVCNKSYDGVFYDNDTSKALLKSMPVKLKMSELNGNEKYRYLSKQYPTNEKRVKKIKAGDIMLYGSDCLVIFYKSFNTSYEYTRVGRITNPKGLKKAAGKKSVTVSFSRKKTIRLSEKNVTLTPGQIKTVRLKGAAAKKVEWSTSNKKTATVSKGRIRARKPGTVTITAKYKNKKYKCKVVVREKEKPVPDREEEKPVPDEAVNEPVNKVPDEDENKETNEAASKDENEAGNKDSSDAANRDENKDANEAADQDANMNENKDTSEDVNKDASEDVNKDASEAASPEGTESSEPERTLTMKIGDKAVAVEWENNESVAALRDLIKESPLTIQMSMYGGFEQVGPIGANLPHNDVQTTTSPGDIVLYSGNQIVVFYGSNSWAYTRLGHITDKNAAEMTALLGNGAVTVTISMEPI